MNLGHDHSQNQCNGGTENSVCRCCCSGTECNWPEKPCVGVPDCGSHYPLNLNLALDTSDSIKYSNFEKIKEFGRKLTENFDFDDAKTSLSLVTFNENSETVLENETDPDLIQDTLKGNGLNRFRNDIFGASVFDKSHFSVIRRA